MALPLNSLGGHDVFTTFSYIDFTSPGWDAPITRTEDGNDLSKASNNHKKFTHLNVIVTDISKCMYDFTLEEHGFQYVKFSSKLTEEDCLDSEKIKEVYFPEIETLLKDVTGASYIHIFNQNIRGPIAGGPNPADLTKGPALCVHCDQSYSGARIVVEKHITDKALAASILKKRYSIINVWRPRKTIHKHPFAVTEAASIPESDLVPLAVQPNDSIPEESWAVKKNSEHRWFYKYAQEPDEVLMFKTFDSVGEDRGIARRVPHSAFVDKDEEHMPPRESIEVRCIVVYD